MAGEPGAPDDHIETLIIGGGQAGIATGYQLSRLGRPFLILDASARVGDAWRTRWDSLRLFTPAKYNGLDGMRFDAPSVSFPTKDEMADYLETYVARFDLPVRTGVKVDTVSRNGHGYVVNAGEKRFTAANVVIAAGAHQIPKAPPFARELDPSIVQLHSFEYKGPAQLKDGPTLVVGLGNSGAEIAFEVVRTHPTLIAGKPSAEIPAKHGPRAARTLLPIIRFVGTHVLNLRTPIGRRFKPKFIKLAAPLIRVKLKDLASAGVEQVARVVGVRNGKPLLEDGRVAEVANVIWCTGFRQDYRWIDLPAFDDEGMPIHDRGVVTSEAGLYFMGLLFQFAAVSDTLPGVSRDAKHVAKHIASRSPSDRAARATREEGAR